MLKYSVNLIEDNNRTYLVASPDFPELTTFGETEGDALANAKNAFDEAIAARIDQGQPTPPPSKGKLFVELSDFAVKAIAAN